MYLTAQQKQFATGIAQAAFANPFTDERAELDRQLTGLPAGTMRPEILRTLLHEVDRFVSQLRDSRRGDLKAYTGSDRDALKMVFLFHTFHRHIASFDELIPRQVKAGEEPLPMPFAAALLEELGRFGFTVPETHRYLSLFWQIRRAFYFIVHGLSGESPCMKSLRHQLWTNVFTCQAQEYLEHMWDKMEDFSTLLLGETGTGKGAAARAIGCSGYIPYNPSTRKFTTSFTRAFVSLNLSQFPQSLLESELFGHKKGAFTGAVEDHVGVFSRCSPHGAIFLDEIGETPVPVQIKLLNVLQERRFTAVGRQKESTFEGRVIAATNQPLEQLRSQGRFRDDFYYRLCSDRITLPSLHRRLQESPGELACLCHPLLVRLAGSTDRLDAVLAALHTSPGPDYTWPGNVRELEQAIRSILLRGHYHPASAPAPGTGTWLTKAAHGELDAKQLLSAYCRMLYEQQGQYGDVAERTGLDWRTVKKYIEEPR